MSPKAMARVSDADCSGVRLRRSRQSLWWPSIVVTTPPEATNDVTQGAAARNVASVAPAGAVTLHMRTSPAPSSIASTCGVGVPSATAGTARKRGSAAVARRGGSAEKASPARARTAFWVE